MGVCVCVFILYVYHIMCTAYKYVILCTQNFAATFDVSLFKWLSSQPKNELDVWFDVHPLLRKSPYQVAVPNSQISLN